MYEWMYVSTVSEGDETPYDVLDEALYDVCRRGGKIVTPIKYKTQKMLVSLGLRNYHYADCVFFLPRRTYRRYHKKKNFDHLLPNWDSFVKGKVEELIRSRR